ncbi:tetratricopeptide repeat protein [Paraglaciecola marina]|uniref:tetratricopeptide repeat protein n=1 Tax=Paraglaciecola marina TaxID=2500157 RepID=UPI00105C2DDC|nr:tetratricopeptide repeat protein [Paraglaciecola marina]
MAAADRDNQKEFDRYFAELKAICVDNENTPTDHPEQWETLADFTDDLAEAVIGYQKALAKAEAINSKDHMSSIGYSMARLQVELGDTSAAIQSLEAAKVSANKIEDNELKTEIQQLLESLG